MPSTNLDVYVSFFLKLFSLTELPINFIILSGLMKSIMKNLKYMILDQQIKLSAATEMRMNLLKRI